MHRPPHRRTLRALGIVLLLIAVAAAVAQLAGVSGGGAQPGTVLAFADGTHATWLVQAPQASAAEVEAAADDLGGGDSGRRLPGAWYEVSLDEEVVAADAEQAFAEVDATQVEPVVARLPYDEPTAMDDSASDLGAPQTPQAPAATLREGAEDAARITEQWGLEQPSDQDIDAVEAWRLGTGSGAIVAVIDTGVDSTHPDLLGRVLPGRDFSGASTGATVDSFGHGTAVASVIAANGNQLAGVAPDARILPLKVFGDSAGVFSMSGYLSAIRYAADQGADVINISLGCGGTAGCYSQAELDALTYAANKGAVIVAAAGNGDDAGNGMNNDGLETPDYPSGYDLPSIVAVTSSTRIGTWSPWSNYGARSVDLAAPGEGILVASPGRRYRSASGTSFAAPFASGVAALIASAQPQLTPVEIARRIETTTSPSATLRARTASGGVLNAYGAVTGTSQPDVAGGGGGTSPEPMAPESGSVFAMPPVLTWSLPSGWRSHSVRLYGGGERHDIGVGASARVLAHPVSAWRGGQYTWQVVARRPDGRLAEGPARTYRVTPRLSAWVTSGRLRSDGRSIRLRVGYAANEPAARIRIIVRSASGGIVHSGPNVSHSAHARGVGSPRRAWFQYDARLRRSLRVGERVSVEVNVSAGGRSLTRRFRARVV